MYQNLSKQYCQQMQQSRRYHLDHFLFAHDLWHHLLDLLQMLDTLQNNRSGPRHAAVSVARQPLVVMLLAVRAVRVGSDPAAAWYGVMMRLRG